MPKAVGIEFVMGPDDGRTETIEQPTHPKFVRSYGDIYERTRKKRPKSGNRIYTWIGEHDHDWSELKSESRPSMAGCRMCALTMDVA